MPVPKEPIVKEWVVPVFDPTMENAAGESTASNFNKEAIRNLPRTSTRNVHLQATKAFLNESKLKKCISFRRLKRLKRLKSNLGKGLVVVYDDHSSKPIRVLIPERANNCVSI